MNNLKYPKWFPKIGAQYWEDPHSMTFTNGDNGSKCGGNGSASLGKQISIEKNGSCVVVVEVVGGPLYTHSLEYEFPIRTLWKKVFFINNGTNILGQSSQVLI